MAKMELRTNGGRDTILFFTPGGNIEGTLEACSTRLRIFLGFDDRRFVNVEPIESRNRTTMNPGDFGTLLADRDDSSYGFFVEPNAIKGFSECLRRHFSAGEAGTIVSAVVCGEV